MLSLIIIWSYIFLICLVYGWAAARFLGRLLQEGEAEPLPASLLIILGLGLVSTITGYLSLGIKIGLAANAMILLGALILAGVCRQGLLFFLLDGRRRLAGQPAVIWVLLVFSAAFILLKAAAPTSSFDTGLYHAQAIRWIEEYPVIPGLGNLHGRLAFNSTWFLPNALFGFAFLKQGPFHVLNGFLLLIMVAYFLAGLGHLFKKEYCASNIFRAVLLLPALLVYKDQLSSPTPDIPVTLLISALFCYYLELEERPAAAARGLMALSLVLVGAWAITIKLTALPLLLLLGVLVVRDLARSGLLNLSITGGALLFLVLPFFLRNIWLSGYLLYPWPGLDLFSWDWKIPRAAVLAEKKAIMEFARDPGHLAPPAAVNSPLGWLPYWLAQMLAAYRTKLEKVVLPGLVLCLDWLVQLVRSKTCKIGLRVVRRYQVLYLTAGGGLLFFFLTAPDPRFAMGFLVVGVNLLFLPFPGAYEYRVTRLFPWALSLLTLYFLVAFTLPELPALPARVFRPAAYRQEALVVQEIQGHRVYLPEKEQTLCWYAPLPSAYATGQFAFRGPDLSDGFKPCKEPR